MDDENRPNADPGFGLGHADQTEAKIEALIKENVHLNRQVKGLMLVNSNKDDLLGKLQVEAEELKDLKDVTSSDALEKAKKSIREPLEREAAAKQIQHQKEMDDFRAKIMVLEADIERFAAEKGEFEVLCKDLAIQNKNRETEASAAEARIKKLQEENSSLASQLAASEQENQEKSKAFLEASNSYSLTVAAQDRGIEIVRKDIVEKVRDS